MVDHSIQPDLTRYAQGAETSSGRDVAAWRVTSWCLTSWCVTAKFVHVIAGALFLAMAGHCASVSARDGNDGFDQHRLPRAELLDYASVETTVGPAGLRRFRWDFSRSCDVDFGGWPDNWRRYTGSGYPNYVGIGIEPRDSQFEKTIQPLDTAALQPWQRARRIFPSLSPLPPSLADILVDRCLTIRLDGGLARVESPALPTNPTYKYQFSVDVMTLGLVHDVAYAEVVFQDSAGNVIARRATDRLGKSTSWTTLVVNDLVPPERADRMHVRLMVSGGQDGLEDINGTASFDNIMFRQFPQLKVGTDKPMGVYKPNETVEVLATLMGIPGEATRLRMRLLNHDGQVLDSSSHEYSSEELNARDELVSGGNEPERVNEANAIPTPDAVESEWTLRDLPSGFYQVTAAMENDRGASLANRTTFVVLGAITNDADEFGDEPTNGPEKRGGSTLTLFSTEAEAIDPLPFGWTLPPDLIRRHRDGELQTRQLAEWVRLLGVGWVKLPVWFAPDDDVSADAAATLAFRMRDLGIQPIGLLDQPPADRLPVYQLRDKADSRVAALFRDLSIWRPELESLMNRMTLRIRWWQIGADDDHSFMGQANLESDLEEIAMGLQGFGQPIQTVIAWPWMETAPAVRGESWRGLHRGAQSPLTAAEMDAMLDRESEMALDESLRRESRRPERNRRGDTWLSIDPISRTRYDRDSRIADLVLRMAATRGHRVEAAFLSHPFDPDAAVVQKDGRPDELLLPWRTASLLLGRRRNAGSLSMQNGTRNIVFQGDESILMVWSDQPTEELVYLGENIYEVDVWGRRNPTPIIEHQGRRVHRVVASRVPRFYVGIDYSLAEFRMSVHLDRTRIDALLGLQQPIGVRFQNPIGQALAGDVAIVAPDAWRLDSPVKPWDLLPGETRQVDFGVTLGNNATIGEYELPIDFRFETTPPTFIRVHRQMSIGPDGFDLRVTTRLINQADENQLRVRIEMVNHTDRQASFDCLLFAGRDRQYERRVIVVPPGETVQRDINWEAGKDLIGTRMWLRAIEQDGKRVINHSFEAQP